MTQRRLFGTDGIRGLANTDPMTPEVAMRLGMAMAVQFRSAHKSTSGMLRHGRIVIGKDTRLSGYLFETAMAAGIVSMGADVMLCGPLPTPGIPHLSRRRCAPMRVSSSARATICPSRALILILLSLYVHPALTVDGENANLSIEA